MHLKYARLFGNDKVVHLGPSQFDPQQHTELAVAAKKGTYIKFIDNPVLSVFCLPTYLLMRKLFSQMCVPNLLMI